MYGLDLPKMYGLDLFTGIGGITLALQDYVIPLAYCEIDSYAQSTLLQNMQEGNLPKAPIWDDIRTLQAKELPKIDIIYGGSPCQDISIAGNQKGLEGERSGLVFEIFRLLDETKAPFVFLENVPNIRTKGAERVCKELAERGYDCRWCNITACDVGARHKRERWFLLGYSKHNGLDAVKEQGSLGQAVCNDSKGENETSESEGTNSPSVLAHSECERLEGQRKPERIQETYSYISDPCGGSVGTKFCRTSYDVPKELDTIARTTTTTETKNRANRIKALGNAVVPLQVKRAFEILIDKAN